MTNDENDTQQNGRRSIRDIPIPRRRTPAPRTTDGVRPAPRAERESPAPEEEAEREVEIEAVEEDTPIQPPHREPMRHEHETEMTNKEEAHLPPPRSYRAERSRRSRKGWFKLLAVAVPVVALIWIFNWHSATVTIAEKHAEKELNLNVPVSLSSDVATGTIAAKSVRVTDRAEKSLPATGEATVQAKAGGTITIVNEYSDEPQTLVRNTRFETPTGLVYRIQEPVTVPGKTAAGGGTVDAAVLADDVGESYNIGPITRFSIPGFSGKPQFDSFYAKSSGSMTGGFNGVRKVADPDLVADAIDELTAELKGRVVTAAASAAGDGYRAFAIPDSFSVSGTGRDPVGDQVTVWVESAAEAYAVSESDLADALARNVIPGYRAKGEARIDNLDSLRVTPRGGAAPTLEVVGLADVTWTVDLNSLESSLLGLPITAFDQVVSRFGGIERATPVVRPFWRSSFPSDPEDIDSSISA